MIKVDSIGGIPLITTDWLEFDRYKLKYQELALALHKPNLVESNVSPQAKFNLYESSFNFLDEFEEFVDLKLWLLESNMIAINNLNQTDYKIAITESWLHVTDKYGFHRPHYHDNSTWSGIFYVDSGGALIGNNFYLPYYMERKPGLEFASDRVTTNFIAGRSILFPSMLLHDAEPHLGNQKRIVIGYNIICF